MGTGKYVLSAFELPANHLYRNPLTLLGYSRFVSMLEEPETAHQDKSEDSSL